jgi:hypothetical protein
MPRFRHGARFIADWRQHCRALDRNERMRILFLAEALERRSKPAGRRNGLLGYVGLAVLRCLAFGFLNPATGLCCPGYAAIVAKTGLCRQSIATGLARLERAGIVRIVRRLVRQRVERVSPITGEPEAYVGTVQTTSLYAFHRPAAYADHLTLPVGRKAPFPPPRQLALLESMQLLWKTKLSLQPRRNPPTPTTILGQSHAPEAAR